MKSSSERQTQSKRRSLVLTIAPNGPTHSVVNYGNIPTDAEQVLDECAQAYDYGCRFVHLHARNPRTGQQFADLEWYHSTFDGVRRQNPGVMVGGPTSRKAEVELEIFQQTRRLQNGRRQKLSADDLARIEACVRAVAIDARPDRITTFTPTEIRMTDTVSDADYRETTAGYTDLTKARCNQPEVIRSYYRFVRRRCQEQGIGEELELTTSAAFPVIERIADDASLGLPRNLFILFLFGYSSKLPIERNQFDLALAWVEHLERRAGLRAHVTVGAAIAPHAAATTPRERGDALPNGMHDYRELFEWVVEDERVESFRVGLEDVPVLYGRQVTNVELALHARALCNEYAVRVITDPDEVRNTFAVPPSLGRAA